MTLSNSLTLAAGSATLMLVSPSPLTNTTVKIHGAVTEAGTLTVSNVSAAAFSSGDHFVLFSAAAYTGGFAAANLPALGAGLAWRTNRLAVDGSLWVVSTAPPAIGNAAIVGGNFILTGTGGTPNWSAVLLAATNLSLPLAQWSPAATNPFDAAGNFAFTNLLNSNAPQTFLTLKVQ